MPINKTHIIINIAKQGLTLYKTIDNNEKIMANYSISTGKNGTGCQEGTGQTPLGKHIIAQKFGKGYPIGSVFVARQATGEIHSQELSEKYPDRDWILSRILWLDGTQKGYNKGTNDHGCCDTYQRYIYIHGTPDTEPMGVALSHGCIRMRNADVVELFDLVEVGTEVEIIEG